jgi:quinolinate synthase
MVLWEGSCVVHDEFRSRELESLRKAHPAAAVLVHPESPREVILQADVVGSTSQLIHAVQARPESEFIVATDNRIFYKMQQAAPGKRLIEAPTGGHSATCRSCAHCPWMAMNDLTSLADALERGHNEIFVDETERLKALTATQRMLDFAAAHRRVVAGTPERGWGAPGSCRCTSVPPVCWLPPSTMTDVPITLRGWPQTRRCRSSWRSGPRPPCGN